MKFDTFLRKKLQYFEESQCLINNNFNLQYFMSVLKMIKMQTTQGLSLSKSNEENMDDIKTIFFQFIRKILTSYSII